MASHHGLLRSVALCLCLPLPAQERAPEVKAFAPVVCAYAAKVAASAIFVSGRTLDSVLAEELAPERPLEALVRPLLEFDVDAAQQLVTCRLLGAEATAALIPGLGCTLVRGHDLAALRARGRHLPPPLPPLPQDQPWPAGEGPVGAVPEDVDGEALARALDAAFADPPGGKVHTRAVVVVCRGRLVAERYGKGYDRTMALPGWSMTKTLALVLLGRAIAAGRLDPEAPLPVPEWGGADDARGKLRLDDLLTMQSGLRWRESYDDPTSPALQMLFGSDDYGGVAAALPQVDAPGTRYRYSSGTTNLLCRVLRAQFANDRDYWRCPRALFDAIGVRSMVLETDPSGTFVGSSFGFATARDWARFGQFLLADGVHAGERLLPAGFLARAREPAARSRGQFGRHVWLNAPADPADPASREWPDLPADLFHLDGHEGQYVFGFPTEQLVVVRLGCTKAARFDLHGLLRAVVDACAPAGAATGR